MPTPHSSRPLTGLRPVVSAIVVGWICVAAGASHIAQPSFATTNGGSITATGVPLTENFDTLASTGTSLAWTDDTTIPGWWSTRTTYNSGTGSSNTGALYSFGVAGTNPVTDRALGSVASGSTGTVFHAVKADQQYWWAGRVARHQLRRRTMAQRRKHHRPDAHLSIPGRRSGHRHRRQCPGNWLDHSSGTELHRSGYGRNSGCARRQRGGESHAEVGHVGGDLGQRTGDLAAVAGSGRHG